MYRHNALDYIRPGSSVADTPAGHGISFGKAIDGDGMVLYFLRDGGDTEVLGAVIDQFLVDLVGYDEEVVLHRQLG